MAFALPIWPKDLAGHETAGVRGKVKYSECDIARSSGETQRRRPSALPDALLTPIGMNRTRLVSKAVKPHGRINPARRDGVGPDPERPQLIGDTPGEHVHPGFRHGIDREPGHRRLSASR